jgi:hypothetical protein
MIDINWGAFGLVFVSALAAAFVIVLFFSVAMRLLSLGPDQKQRPLPATVGAIVCIAICVAAVLYGIYLVIPLFHGK